MSAFLLLIIYPSRPRPGTHELPRALARVAQRLRAQRDNILCPPVHKKELAREIESCCNRSVAQLNNSF